MNTLESADLKTQITKEPNIKKGCLVDTNILFSSYFSDDKLHEKSLGILSALIENQVPMLTNVNIRSEFINLALRAIVPQGLSDLFKDAGSALPKEIYRQLKSIHQTINDGIKNERVIKLQDTKIKSVRNILSQYFKDGVSFWDIFCDKYLAGKLESEWSYIESDLGLNFISLTSAKGAEHLRAELEWSDVIKIMERTAIGSADAMILNLLDKSRYSLIASLDEDIKYAMNALGMDDKYLLC